MKRIIPLLLALVITLCAGGCGEQPASPSGSDTAQYVIAMNPSVMLESGEVVSIRNSIAQAMQSDIDASDEYELYEGTPWQWISRGENGVWDRRAIRGISNWSRMYCYRFNDELTDSLAVYDTSRMEISGCDGGSINDSGVVWAFDGAGEEGICYTAGQDCLIELSDRDMGSIAAVGSAFGDEVSFLDSKDAKSALHLRIYKNNRIYWQEVIDRDTPSVAFPTFTGIELKAGDVIIITAQAVDSADGIARGNCDLPDTTEVITVRNENTYQQLVEKQPEQMTEIPLVADKRANFTIVYPDDCEESTKLMIDDFTAAIEEKLEIYPQYIPDSSIEEESGSYYLLVGKTAFAESEAALNELKAARENNAADFIIKQQGNKIIITADNDYSLSYGIEFFLNNYATDANSSIPTGLNYLSANYNTLKELKLGGSDISEYRIVYSYYGSFMEASAADYLAESILKTGGVLLETVRDRESAAGGKEILIGNTDRISADYSKNAETASGNSYSIAVGSGRTSVTGESVSAVNAGVIDLCGKLAQNGSLAAGSYTGSYDGGYSLTDGYKLSWSDEFNGNELGNVWRIAGANDEENVLGGITYKDKGEASVKDGTLQLKASIAENDRDIYTLTLETNGKMFFKYGYAEIRAKISTVKGFGSSFWSCTRSAGLGVGEFDIFECFGSLYNIKSNLHIWNDSGHENVFGDDGSIGNSAPGTDSSEPYGISYHTIGMEWTEDYVQYYVDGQPTTRQDMTGSKFDVFDQYADLKLGTSGGETWNSNMPDGSIKESVYYIDWIRVWQKEDQRISYRG